MSKKVLISIGSNLGDKLLYIEMALSELSLLRKTELLNTSSLMQTSPVGVTGQDDYLNMVVLVETSLSPWVLLKELNNIEVKIGRKKRARWAKREIDLDIIIYEGVSIKGKKLTIPHKEFYNRLFVLKGSAELMPDYVVDMYNLSIMNVYLSRKTALIKEQSLKTLGK